MNLSKNRLVITGIGAITPIGVGNSALWQGILEKRSGIERVSISVGNHEWENYFCHKVKNYDVSNSGLDGQLLESIRIWKGGEHNKDLLFFLGAIRMGLNDAQLAYSNENNELSLVVTHENFGIEQFMWRAFIDSYEILTKSNDINKIDYFNRFYSQIVKLGYETQSFMPLFHIAKMFNIHNYSIYINNACASGQFALELAKDIILSGKSKAVIVVGGDCPDVFKYKWFRNLNMYPDDGKTKPFDKRRNGFLLGEGAVALILEDFNHAKERDAYIYAEYLGASFQLESWGITTPKIGGGYYQKIILDALIDAGISRNEIDLVCSHGVATPTSDYYEAQSILEVFQDKFVPVTALKPYIGHNLGGSNLIEIAILLLAIKNNYIPPTMNTTLLDSKLPINLILTGRAQKINTILKLCCAFAGYDAATILRRLD